jgi:hypothetical protein
MQLFLFQECSSTLNFEVGAGLGCSPTYMNVYGVFRVTRVLLRNVHVFCRNAIFWRLDVVFREKSIYVRKYNARCLFLCIKEDWGTKNMLPVVIFLAHVCNTLYCRRRSAENNLYILTKELLP